MLALAQHIYILYIMTVRKKEISFTSPIQNPILYEIGFWWHMVVWIIILTFPFYMPIWINVLLVCLFRLQLMIFDGCVFTRIQQRIGILPPGLEYYNAIAIRVFKYKKFDDYKLYVITELTEIYFLATSVIVFLINI